MANRGFRTEVLSTDENALVENDANVIRSARFAKLFVMVNFS